MRIISGIFKGKKILQPLNSKTRPLKDLTKESIFNIIRHSNKFTIDLNTSEILDLFSGTGSFGIECLSRGAKHVTFVENYDEVLPILKKNLTNLKSIRNYLIIEKDILKNLKLKIINRKYDIIFLDPPYKEKKFMSLISIILDEQILNNDGIIIIHRHKNQKDIFPKAFKIIEEKKYGISKIIFGSYS